MCTLMAQYSYRFLHFSDTHLSRNYPAIRGMLRLRAYNAAFNQAIQTAIREKVDFVIHTGDLFETSKPQARVVQFARRRLQQLHKNGIPFILIRGNHGGSYTGTGVVAGVAHDYVTDIPQDKKDSIDILADELPLAIIIDPDVSEKYSKQGLAYKKVHVGEDLEIMGVGYRGKGLIFALRKYFQEEGNTNRDKILMLHSFIEGVTSVPPGQIPPTVEEINALSDHLRYVATGHEHTYRERKVDSIQFLCPGCTEPRIFSESEDEHYYVITDITSSDIQITKIPVKPIQTMIYRKIESDRAQNPVWYQEELTRVINEIKTLDDNQIFVRIKLKGLISAGHSIADLRLKEFDKQLVKENIMFKDIDSTELNITPITTVFKKQQQQPILAQILKKAKLPPEDIEIAEIVFHEVQELLNDENAITQTGGLRKETKERIRELIDEKWKLED